MNFYNDKAKENSWQGLLINGILQGAHDQQPSWSLQARINFCYSRMELTSWWLACHVLHNPQLEIGLQ